MFNSNKRMAELYTEADEGKKHEQFRVDSWGPKDHVGFYIDTPYREGIPTLCNAVDRAIDTRYSGGGTYDEYESLFLAGKEYGTLVAERRAEDKGVFNEE